VVVYLLNLVIFRLMTTRLNWNWVNFRPPTVWSRHPQLLLLPGKHSAVVVMTYVAWSHQGHCRRESSSKRQYSHRASEPENSALICPWLPTLTPHSLFPPSRSDCHPVEMKKSNHTSQRWYICGSSASLWTLSIIQYTNFNQKDQLKCVPKFYCIISNFFDWVWMLCSQIRADKRQK